MSAVQPSQPAGGPGWSWYHSVLTTYGSWLPGDPRGFRTRHQREQVDGDYKHPPAEGTHGHLADVCRQSLTQPAVTIPPELRPMVGAAMRGRLQGLGGLVIAVSIAAEHIHILAKMLACQARGWIGLAKKHAWFELRNRGWQGKLWGKRSQNVIVRDRGHQLNVFDYISRHGTQGAWVWKWGDE